VIALSIYTGSILPLMFIGLPALYGSWLQFIYGHTQHAGLAENVLDHRLNSRTIYLNPVNRYLYWEMNYHVEHHMFPLVPYHNLARLHELIKGDMPKPYSGLLEAWREIVPALVRQWKDPVLRPTALPTPSIPRRRAAVARFHRQGSRSAVGSRSAPHSCERDVIRFDHEQDRTPSTRRTAICTPPTAFAPTATPSGRRAL
jgi:hypothetical protein